MYSFASINMIIEPEVIVINRQAYGLLDYLGDIGGLIDALRYIIYLIF